MLSYFAVVTLLSAASLAGALRAAPVAPRTRAVHIMAADKSASVPFLLKPELLQGQYAGDVGFDPLGLSKIGENMGPLGLYWMREAELKHARVAMLAVLGILAVEGGLVFPGQPNAANQVQNIYVVAKAQPALLFGAMIFIGILELIQGSTLADRQRMGLQPGDFSLNPINFGRTERTRKDLALKEIKNGRLAMIAAAGLLVQETLSPLRAIEALGAM